MNIAIFHHAVTDDLNSIRDSLITAGHDCTTHGSTKALFDWLQAGTCDLLIVDTPVVRIDTTELLRAAKAAAGGILPVLLLIDGMGADALVAALVAGADDFLVKPVRYRDLMMRAKVLLYRAWPDKRASALLRFGRIVFDTLASCASLDGNPVALTQKEFALALLFFRHIGQPLSRATLLETIWSQDANATSRTVDTHASRVRTKLGLQAGDAYRLVPVYGYGYLLEGEWRVESKVGEMRQIEIPSLRGTLGQTPLE